MTDLIASPLPTIDEILGGQSQGGVPRPAFLQADDDDGTVQRVGSVPVDCAPPAPIAPARVTLWQKFAALFRRKGSARHE